MGKKSLFSGVQAKGSDRIQFDFEFEGSRYRPTLRRIPSETNLRRAHKQLADIRKRIERGTFNFEEEFPNYRYKTGLAVTNEEEAKPETCDDVFDKFLACCEHRVSMDGRIQVVDATVTDAKVKEGRRRLSMNTNKTDRTCLASEQRAEIWRRWRAGELVVRIAKALDRPYSTVHQQICIRGGCAPYDRRGNPRALSLGEREEISRGISAGHSIRQIARRLQRAPSTVSREIARHGGRSSYRAARAERAAWRNGQRPKACKLAVNTRLRAYVASKLALQWSPEQIAHDLAERFGTDNSMQVSHETIYRSLFIQARGALKRELLAHLRSGRRMRQARKSTRAGQGQILEAVSIRERPAQVTDRAVPGHWEGDLLCGGTSSQIATLVERQSRFVMLVKLSANDSATVVNALSTQMRKLPTQLRRSLTWDRGLELAEHKRFSCATDIRVYFCDPHSPWQRGSNENTNGLLRQYFPKGASLSGYSQADLNRIALRLNTRPRKTLGFRTPADKFNDAVASTT